MIFPAINLHLCQGFSMAMLNNQMVTLVSCRLSQQNQATECHVLVIIQHMSIISYPMVSYRCFPYRNRPIFGSNSHHHFYQGFLLKSTTFLVPEIHWHPKWYPRPAQGSTLVGRTLAATAATPVSWWSRGMLPRNSVDHVTKLRNSRRVFHTLTNLRLVNGTSFC